MPAGKVVSRTRLEIALEIEGPVVIGEPHGHNQLPGNACRCVLRMTGVMFPKSSCRIGGDSHVASSRMLDALDEVYVSRHVGDIAWYGHPYRKIVGSPTSPLVFFGLRPKGLPYEARRAK